jgi:hypothetical protein
VARGRVSRLTVVLATITVALTALSAILRWAVSFAGVPDEGAVGVISRLIWVQRDANIPTWFSSFLLLIASALVWQLVQIHRESQIDRPSHLNRLRVLAFGFLYMSIDETARIHEQLNDPLDALLGLGGPFGFPWVVVAIPLVIVLALVYADWVRTLPKGVRGLVILGAVTFVAGSIGVEMLGAQLATSSGPGVEGGMAHIEEFGEMLGMVFFIEAMMRLLKLEGWDGTLRFSLMGASTRVDEDLDLV